MAAPVFISYSHADKLLAKDLSKRLKAIGLDHFLDEKAIHWGTAITPTVRKELADCFAIVVIVSHASHDSAWVAFEVGHALGAISMGAKKLVLPLLTYPSLKIPGYLGDIDYMREIRDVVQFFQSAAWENHVSACCADRSKIERQLREEIGKLKDWLERYMPGGKEPEDL